MNTTTLFNHTGWVTVGGEHAFLTTTGALSAGGLDPSMQADLGAGNLKRYALPAPPCPRDTRSGCCLCSAIRASLDFLSLAPYGVTLPLWASMYAAPLSPFATLSATLWVYGATEDKAALSHLALAHFGSTFVDGDGYHTPQDWSSTPAELEQALFTIKDAPLLIGDYASDPSRSFFKAQPTVRKVHSVVRSVGNRPGAHGDQASDSPARQPRPPRGLVMVTATQRLVGQSLGARLIYVPVEAGQVIDTGETRDGEETKPGTQAETRHPKGTCPGRLWVSARVQARQHATTGLYAQAMAGYIAWLARDWDRLAREVPERILQARHASQELLPGHLGRAVGEHYGLLTTATSLALEYARDHGGLTGAEMELLAGVCQHQLVDLLRSQAERDPASETRPIDEGGNSWPSP